MRVNRSQFRLPNTSFYYSFLSRDLFGSPYTRPCTEIFFSNTSIHPVGGTLVFRKPAPRYANICRTFVGPGAHFVSPSLFRLLPPLSPRVVHSAYLLGHVVMDTGLQKRSWNEGKEKRPNICRSTSVPRTLISFFSGQDSDTGRSQTDPSSPSLSLNERVANRRKK